MRPTARPTIQPATLWLDEHGAQDRGEAELNRNPKRCRLNRRHKMYAYQGASPSDRGAVSLRAVHGDRVRTPEVAPGR